MNQISFTALTMTEQILLPYFQLKNMNQKSRRNLIQQYYYEFIGFGLPFSLLNMIPIIGGIFQIYCQGAGASLVYQLIELPMDTTKDTGTSSSSSNIPPTEKMKMYEPVIKSPSKMSGEITQEIPTARIASITESTNISPVVPSTTTIIHLDPNTKQMENKLNYWSNNIYTWIHHGMGWIGNSMEP